MMQQACDINGDRIYLVRELDAYRASLRCIVDRSILRGTGSDQIGRGANDRIGQNVHRGLSGRSCSRVSSCPYQMVHPSSCGAPLSDLETDRVGMVSAMRWQRRRPAGPQTRGEQSCVRVRPPVFRSDGEARRPPETRPHYQVLEGVPRFWCVFTQREVNATPVIVSEIRA
jgi:hypothetical protein